MTSPPKGMPASMAKRYSEIESNIDKVVTMNRGLIESGGLSAKGYDPNEMVEIDDKKTGKKMKVPYGSYEHQSSIYIPRDKMAKNYMGIGEKDAGVQRFSGEDLSNFNANPLNRRSDAGLKTEEIRSSKGSTVFKKGASEATGTDFFTQQYETPIKGVTDLPSRYNKEQEILKDYKKEKDDLAAMDKEWAEVSKPMPIRPIKRELPKLQGKMSDLTKETTWKDPTGGKFKRKGAIEKSGKVEAKGPKGAGGGRSASVNLSIFTKKINPNNNSSFDGVGILRGPGSGEAKGLRAREEKMAKSFYAPKSQLGHGDYSSIMEGAEGNVSKAIRSDIKDIRQEKRDWKKQTSSTGSEKRAGAKEFREDIKTGRLASRYAKRGDLKSIDTNPLDAESGGVWKAGNKSKLKIYTPDLTKSGEEGAMSGYKDAGKQERSRMNQLQTEETFKMYPYSKSAEDNATNRNSTSERMKKFWKY